MLAPVCSGKNFEITSPPESALVTREVAKELKRALEQFGEIAKRSGSGKVNIFFKPGIFGHHRVGRAVDIYTVNGVGLDIWKRRWDAARQRAFVSTNPAQRAGIVKSERCRNLGWQLYKALQVLGNGRNLAAIQFSCLVHGPERKVPGSTLATSSCTHIAIIFMSRSE